jgi:diacylglycerol kinase (ATP)
VAVANGAVFGGGLMISPDSRMTDGKLELVLAEPLSRPAIVKLFPKLYDGSHLADSRIRVIQATSIEISQHGHEGGQGHESNHGDGGGRDALRGGALLPPAFADGELVGRAPLKVAVAPLALRVLGATPRI